MKLTVSCKQFPNYLLGGHKKGGRQTLKRKVTEIKKEGEGHKKRKAAAFLSWVR